MWSISKFLQYCLKRFHICFTLYYTYSLHYVLALCSHFSTWFSANAIIIPNFIILWHSNCQRDYQIDRKYMFGWLKSLHSGHAGEWGYAAATSRGPHQLLPLPTDRRDPPGDGGRLEKLLWTIRIQADEGLDADYQVKNTAHLRKSRSKGFWKHWQKTRRD